jgi:hypothetical protein
MNVQLKRSGIKEGSDEEKAVKEVQLNDNNIEYLKHNTYADDKQVKALEEQVKRAKLKFKKLNGETLGAIKKEGKKMPEISGTNESG